MIFLPKATLSSKIVFLNGIFKSTFLRLSGRVAKTCWEISPNNLLLNLLFIIKAIFYTCAYHLKSIMIIVKKNSYDAELNSAKLWSICGNLDSSYTVNLQRIMAFLCQYLSCHFTAKMTFYSLVTSLSIINMKYWLR